MSTILIVDDNPEIVELFKIMLTLDGHEIITASSGTMCLEKLKEYNPDLILLDIFMEDLDGWATLMHIKNNIKTTSIPVIMVTAKNLEGKEIQTYGRLYKDYIMKPIGRKQLCEVVRNAINKP